MTQTYDDVFCYVTSLYIASIVTPVCRIPDPDYGILDLLMFRHPTPAKGYFFSWWECKCNVFSFLFPDKGPKTVKLFVNQPHTLDFDSADSREPAQLLE